jgi:hypothetical protein
MQIDSSGYNSETVVSPELLSENPTKAESERNADVFLNLKLSVYQIDRRSEVRGLAGGLCTAASCWSICEMNGVMTGLYWVRNGECKH